MCHGVDPKDISIGKPAEQQEKNFCIVDKTLDSTRIEFIYAQDSYTATKIARAKWDALTEEEKKDRIDFFVGSTKKDVNGNPVLNEKEDFLTIIETRYSKVLGADHSKGVIVNDHTQFPKKGKKKEYTLEICELNRAFQPEEKFQYEDIRYTLQEITFMDRETLQATVDLLCEVLRDWKDE